MYDDLKAHLEVWGYTVESRTTPWMDNGDADVIVILPEDGYTFGGIEYTSQEAAWLMDFVDSGRGLFGGLCPNADYNYYVSEVTTLRLGCSRHPARLHSGLRVGFPAGRHRHLGDPPFLY